MTEAMEFPDKLLADLDDFAKAYAWLMSEDCKTVAQAAALIRTQHLALEAVTRLAEKAAAETRMPDWVADFLNRGTEVEHVLRLPANVRKNNALHDRDDPLPPTLTPDQMWELANLLSVPNEFGHKTEIETYG